MMNFRRRSLLAIAGVTALLTAMPAAAQAGKKVGAFEDPQLEVIASGLHQPRHLVAKDGNLWVAETGDGGSEQCVNGMCLGHTGSIALVNTDTGWTSRVITGLPSIAGTGGGSANGAVDVSLANGRVSVLMSNVANMLDPVTGDTPFDPNAPEMGRVVHYGLLGKQLGPDFGRYEAENNPDGGAGAPPGAEKESNSYGIAAYNGGYAVVDAGANTVLFVNGYGQVSTLAVLPTEQIGDRAVHAVPTAVEVGPDGALYVATLRGGVAGHAEIYRIVPGQAPTVYADGFNQLMDLAFDTSGRLLALSWSASGVFFPPNQGAIVRVEADGSKTYFTPAGMVAPTGIAVEGRNVYVSVNGIFPNGAGKIARVRLP